MPALEDALTQLLARLNEPAFAFSLREVSVSDWKSLRYRAGTQIAELASELPRLVASDPRFSSFAPVRMAGDGSVSDFFPCQIADPLVARLIATGSSAQCVDWLSRVLSLESAWGCAVTALWGAEVDAPIVLSETTMLVPLDTIPDSPSKRDALTFGSQGPAGVFFEPPSSALVTRKEIKPLYYTESGRFEIGTSFFKTNAQHSEFTLALTAVGPSLPLVASHWFTFEDEDVRAAELGHARSWPMLEIVPKHRSGQVRLDAQAVVDMVNGYESLNDKMKAKITVALKRLRQSLARHDLGDRTVELATAFECLTSDSKTEVSHKLMTRTVRYLGGDADERRFNSRVLKALYSMRSDTVHGSTLSKTEYEVRIGERWSAEQVAETATALCAKFIRSLVHHKAIPEWSEFDILEAYSPASS